MVQQMFDFAKRGPGVPPFKLFSQQLDRIQANDAISMRSMIQLQKNVVETHDSWVSQFKILAEGWFG